jgi:hypothetical protein
MTITYLLQVVPARLIQAVRNKLLRACCHQLVNNLLRADYVRLVVSDLIVTLSNINQNVPLSRSRGLFIKWRIRVMYKM